MNFFFEKSKLVLINIMSDFEISLISFDKKIFFFNDFLNFFSNSLSFDLI